MAADLFSSVERVQARSELLDRNYVLFSEVSAHVAQNLGEHGWRQTACERVLLARVVGSKETRKISGKRKSGAVRKRISGMTGDAFLLFEDLKVCSQSNSAQYQNGFWLQNVQLGLKIRAAVREFGGKRLVCRRSAANRGANIGIPKCEAIVPAYRRRLIGEAGAMKCVEEEIARAVAGERAARPISAMSSGSKSYDEKLRVWIAEAGDRLAPVVPVKKSAPLGASHGFAIPDKARALAAAYNRVVQDSQFLFRIHGRPSTSGARDEKLTRRQRGD
jgi:hypothetical protein